jgi:hypothetical protein
MKEILKKIDGAKKVSDKAIAQFTTTEETLIKQNEVIASAMDEAEVEIQRLQAVKEMGFKKHSENTGIIERIGNIVRGS